MKYAIKLIHEKRKTGNELCGLRLSVKALLDCFAMVAVAAASDGKSLDEADTVFAFCSAAACASATFGCFAHVGRKSAVCGPLPLLIPLNVLNVAVVVDVDPVKLTDDFTTYKTFNILRS